MKNKSTTILALLSLSTLIYQPSTSFAQGRAFTCQGRLNGSGVPANGAYDFRFRLFDALTNGSFSGGNIFLDAVGVSNGLFTVTHALGPAALNGNARWLEIGVKTNGGPDYLYLVPRQTITATPYALTAADVNLDGQPDLRKEPL